MTQNLRSARPSYPAGAPPLRIPPTIGLVDPCCPRPYMPSDVDDGGLGGTEATVTRIVVGLHGRVRFVQFQQHRAAPARDGIGGYDRLDRAGDAGGLDGLVVINSWKLACRLRKSHPDLPIYLWLHVHPGRHNRKMGAALHAAGIVVICVSASHAATLRAFLAPCRVDIRHVFNPIADDLRPSNVPRDPNRMLFASAPHKGLDQVFDAFRRLRGRIPDLILDVADPGYLAWRTGPAPEGVRFIGTLPHDMLMARMRRSLCLFYPQSRFAETFGLVIAEANAVGTPALLHTGLGANDEIARSAGQCIDTGDMDAVHGTIARWRANPPRINLPEEFRLIRVLDQWESLLAPEMPAQAMSSSERSGEISHQNL
ncbi:glycosyltransferase family 4 protein [Profundibacterium mesophilum]|uniref:Glycosyltransferase WbpY n=1 Tax=Profundibacterium mesophilum KAUST100406-0324 TaxID=1037889 RepID=A0A921NUW7_9RHOB|nr:glycosyltransferase family 4 protein [Profundibacterium mesophilum]KAF0676038.1 Glycosyltransferase WbpY [Profundibacterium mesophilum KAUST100406-0324]